MCKNMSLLALVESGNKEALLQKLESMKASNSSKEFCERSLQNHNALDLAALLGRQELLEMLIDYGADINSMNKSGRLTLQLSLLLEQSVHAVSRVQCNASQCGLGPAEMPAIAGRERCGILQPHALQRNTKGYGTALRTAALCGLPHF